MHTTYNYVIRLQTKIGILLLSIAVDLANAAVEELKSARKKVMLVNTQTQTKSLTTCCRSMHLSDIVSHRQNFLPLT